MHEWGRSRGFSRHEIVTGSEAYFPMLAPATDGNAGVGCDICGSAAMPASTSNASRTNCWGRPGEGAMPAPKRAVILRESGVSSTLGPIGSITAVSGILHHPLSRVMTVEGVARVRDKLLGIQFSNSALCKTQLRDLAAHVARDLLSNFLTLLIRGRRECRAPMRRGKKCARSHHGHTGITRHSPRNGFTVSFVLSPAIGLFCHRHLRDLPQA